MNISQSAMMLYGLILKAGWLISPHGIAMPKGLYFTAMVFSSLSFFFRLIIYDVNQTWTRIHL